MAWSTTALPGRPAERWNELSADAVRTPNTPSGRPSEVWPTVTRYCCSVRTRSPRDPSWRPMIVPPDVDAVDAVAGDRRGGRGGGRVRHRGSDRGRRRRRRRGAAATVVVGAAVVVVVAGTVVTDPGSTVTASSAAAVAASTVPVAGRPLFVWNCLSAVAVPAPKMPSAPPGTAIPAAISFRWSVRTASPRPPCARPTSEPDASPSARAVASSTTPVTLRPFAVWKFFSAVVVAASEDAVGATGHRETQVHQRLLHRSHRLAAGALLQTGHAHRRGVRRRVPAERERGQPEHGAHGERTHHPASRRADRPRGHTPLSARHRRRMRAGDPVQALRSPNLT